MNDPKEKFHILLGRPFSANETFVVFQNHRNLILLSINSFLKALTEFTALQQTKENP